MHQEQDQKPSLMSWFMVCLYGLLFFVVWFAIIEKMWQEWFLFGLYVLLFSMFMLALRFLRGRLSR